jgi:hypothetical protein
MDVKDLCEPENSDSSQDKAETAREGNRTGKTDTRWTLHESFTGTMEAAQARLTEILEEYADEMGFREHPYKRTKRTTSVLDHGELWHCKNKRKYGGTLSCPYRCTTKCEFRIKYQYKNAELQLWTIGQHSHTNETRVRGLRLEKAVKVLKAVGEVPASKIVLRVDILHPVLICGACSGKTPSNAHRTKPEQGDGNIAKQGQGLPLSGVESSCRKGAESAGGQNIRWCVSKPVRKVCLSL